MLPNNANFKTYRQKSITKRNKPQNCTKAIKNFKIKLHSRSKKSHNCEKAAKIYSGK